MRKITEQNQLSFLGNKYVVRTEDNYVYLVEDTGWYVIWTITYTNNQAVLHTIEERFRALAQQMSWHIIGADDAVQQLRKEYPDVYFGTDIKARHLLNKGK